MDIIAVTESTTLKEEIFVERHSNGFAVFDTIRKSLNPHNFPKSVIRES